MLDLLFLLVLTIWSGGVGLSILRRLAPVPEHPTDRLALTVPLGLGTLSLATMGLAELGWLGRSGLAIIFVLGAGLGLNEWVNRRRMPLVACPPVAYGGLRQRLATDHFIGLAFDLALVAVVLGTLLTALGPVTDGDALCYHLQVPKVFLERGAAVFEPDLHETVYPLVTELLYAVALAWRGPVACRLVQWVLGLVFAASVTALARPVLGPRARWAGTIALLVPAVSNGMGAPLNDVALAAFGNAALLAWVRWRDRPSPGAAALAGVLAGLALGVKYPALVWVGVLGGGMAAGVGMGIGRREFWPRATDRFQMTDEKYQGTYDMIQIANGKFRISNFKFQIINLKSYASNLKPDILKVLAHTALFGTVALMVGGGWYLRAYAKTGNPVHPFFRQVFGGAGLDEVLDPIKRPLPVRVGSLLTALGPMTLHPERFDSLAHQFGPAFLLFLPGLMLMRPPRRVLGLVALGFVFLTACLTVRQSMRFVLIAVGPMALGVAWLAREWSERRTFPGRALLGLLLLVLGYESALALGRSRHGLGVVLGQESAAAFLDRREPTYRVGRWVAGHLPESARLVGQDHRGFYLPRPYTMELAHRRRTGLGTRGESAAEIVAQLRRSGFTHLLLCPPIPESAVEFDPTLGRLLAPWLAEQVPLYRREITDADGVGRCYAIYGLMDPSGETPP